MLREPRVGVADLAEHRPKEEMGMRDIRPPPHVAGVDRAELLRERDGLAKRSLRAIVVVRDRERVCEPRTRQHLRAARWYRARPREVAVDRLQYGPGPSYERRTRLKCDVRTWPEACCAKRLMRDLRSVSAVLRTGCTVGSVEPRVRCARGHRADRGRAPNSRHARVALKPWCADSPYRPLEIQIGTELR